MLDAPPGSIDITDFEFDGQCANITVNLADVSQLRSYCFNQERWFRAPLSLASWGQDEQVIDLGKGATLHFLPRDQAFAETLAADLVSGD